MLPLVVWLLLTDVSHERRPDGGDGKFFRNVGQYVTTLRGATSQKPNYFYFLVCIGPPPQKFAIALTKQHIIIPSDLRQGLDLWRGTWMVGVRAVCVWNLVVHVTRRVSTDGVWEQDAGRASCSEWVPPSETLVLLPLQWTSIQSRL
jgi:hypothetical protein